MIKYNKKYIFLYAKNNLLLKNILIKTQLFFIKNIFKTKM